MWANIGGRLGQPSKVKAHVSLEQPRALGQGELWHGNAAADAVAKKRAMVLLPPEGLRKELCTLEATKIVSSAVSRGSLPSTQGRQHWRSRAKPRMCRTHKTH